MTELTEFYGEPLYVYTSSQAVEDGILWEVDPATFRTNIFSYVTTNLMCNGYMRDDGSVNQPNCVDLFIQSGLIYQRNWKKGETEYMSGNIELPDGHKQKIYIAQNETGKYTIMLPTDR